MKLIIITNPQFFREEVAAITSLFRAGLEILHLRKPGASVAEIERLLQQLPAEYLPRIVTHEHFPLTSAWHLKGIHLNGRNPQAPAGYQGHISRSCHSLQEVAKYKPSCNYVFLSPIYNSISKEGYASAFTRENLRAAQQAGIIDSKVIALGGINARRLPEVEALGFGGAALLGDIWNRPDCLHHFQELKQSLILP